MVPGNGLGNGGGTQDLVIDLGKLADLANLILVDEVANLILSVGTTKSTSNFEKIFLLIFQTKDIKIKTHV